jgi:hypothetical protein
MRRFFDYAIFIDLILVTITIIFSCFGQPIVNKLVLLQTPESLNGFIVSLNTICATLLGFLLTIITVIITFKKGFEDNNSLKNEIKPENEVKKKSVFANTSKEQKFYSSNIHKKVVSVFGNAAYEIGIVIFLLLIIQFNVIHLTLYWEFVLSFCSLLMTVSSVIRSLYIFTLFLKVHL